MADHADERTAAPHGLGRDRGVLAGVLEQATQGGRLLADLGQQLRAGRSRSGTRCGHGGHCSWSRGANTGAATGRSRRFSSVTSR